MYQAATAPQSIGGVLDDGFRLYRAALGRVIVLTFVALVLGQIPGVMMTTSGGIPDPSSMLVPLLICSVLSAVCYAAVIARMNAVAEQRDMPLSEAVGVGLRRLLPLLVYSLLYGVIVAVGMVLLIVPGMIFGLSLMFGAFMVVVEGRGPVDGLAASHRLVWGHWWRTALIMTVAMFVVMAVYMLIAFVSGFTVALASTAPTILGPVLQLVVVPVVGGAVTPLFYALALAVFYDLRLRRSGADLEQRLDAPAPA